MRGRNFRRFSVNGPSPGRFRQTWRKGPALLAVLAKKGKAYSCTFRFQARRYYFTVGKV